MLSRSLKDKFFKLSSLWLKILTLMISERGKWWERGRTRKAILRDFSAKFFFQSCSFKFTKILAFISKSYSLSLGNYYSYSFSIPHFTGPIVDRKIRLHAFYKNNVLANQRETVHLGFYVKDGLSIIFYLFVKQIFWSLLRPFG